MNKLYFNLVVKPKLDQILLEEEFSVSLYAANGDEEPIEITVCPQNAYKAFNSKIWPHLYIEQKIASIQFYEEMLSIEKGRPSIPFVLDTKGKFLIGFELTDIDTVKHTLNVSRINKYYPIAIATLIAQQDNRRDHYDDFFRYYETGLCKDKQTELLIKSYLNQFEDMTPKAKDFNKWTLEQKAKYCLRYNQPCAEELRKGEEIAEHYSEQAEAILGLEDVTAHIYMTKLRKEYERGRALFDVIYKGKTREEVFTVLYDRIYKAVESDKNGGAEVEIDVLVK
ncbi:MAG: hypothetical protein AB7S44_03225 [Spirochaetales bacterium]